MIAKLKKLYFHILVINLTLNKPQGQHVQHGHFNTTLLLQCTLGTDTIIIYYRVLIYYTASPLGLTKDILTTSDTILPITSP